MSYIITTHAVISVLCWSIVASGATMAVFSRTVKDTFAERIGLGAIAIAACATVFRVIRQGWISEGFLALSVAFAFYVSCLIWKHWKGPEPAPTPVDKTVQGDLE